MIGGRVRIARCPEHGLHGCRGTCFECGGPVEQIEMVPAEAYDELAGIMAACRRIVAAQAEDEALWCPLTATEAYVVQELRTLHRAVEGDLTALAAVEDP